MKHTFKFLTFLLLFALSFGFNQEVKADPNTGYSINYPYIYFLNNDNWSQCGVLYGRKWGNNDSESYTSMQNMTKVSNTEKLYYAEVTSYWNNTYNQIAIVAANGWGGTNQHIEARYNGVSHTGVYYNYTMNYHNTYYITSTGSTNIDISYKSKGYDDIPKTTAKIQVQTRNSRGDYTTLSSGTAPATVTLQGTHMNGNGTTDRNTVTWDGEKEYNVVISGKVTTSYSTMDSKYQFDGWYIGSSKKGTDASYNYYQSSATTVIARFTRIKYTVTLDADGGSGGATSITATYDKAMPTISSSDFPTRTGFTFDGYYTGKNGTGTKYYNADGTSANTCDLTDNITLYAKWAVVLTVDKGIGIASVSESVNPASLDGQYDISATTATGYNFNQWTASPTANAQFVNASSATTKVTIKNGSVTVTATATEILHSVTMAASDNNKGTVAITSDNTTAGIATPITIQATPKAGYYFTGWTASDGSKVTFGNAKSETTTANVTADDITITANFAERFYLRGSIQNKADTETGGMPGWGDDAKDSGKGLFTTIDGNTATITKTLEAETEYKLKLGDLQGDCSWGGSNEFTNDADLWTFACNAKNDCAAPTFRTSIAGDYTFTIDFSAASPKMKITYPDVPDFTLSVAEARVYEETPMANFIAGNGTEENPYQFYLDEKMTLTVTALSPVTGVTAYYKFGDDAESSTVLTKDITAANTTVQSIVVKTYYKGNIGSYTSAEKTETIYYQGVAVPALHLSASWNEKEESELSENPQVIIYYSADKYLGAATVTSSVDGVEDPNAFMTITDKSQDEKIYQMEDKTPHRYDFAASATVNGRDFAAATSVSVYRLVKVTVSDPNRLMNHYYAWIQGTKPIQYEQAWPGKEFEGKLGDAHIFFVKYPSYTHFVLNDGKAENATQTVDIELPTESTCYTIGGKTDNKYTVNSGSCPPILYVGNIENVTIAQGESQLIAPDVDLDYGYSESQLTITFPNLPSNFTAVQQGKKFLLTGNTQCAATNIKAVYTLSDGVNTHSEERTFNATVTHPSHILIQVKYNDQDLGWGGADMHIRYWGKNIEKTIDLTWKGKVDGICQSYARIPLDEDNQISFLIHAWPLDGNKPWQQTVDVQNVSASGCYTILVEQDTESKKRKYSRDGDDCWAEYQVKIDMASGVSYTSNAIENMNDIVSFYAPGKNETGTKSGLVRIMRNGTQVATVDGNLFNKSGVYTAKIVDNGGIISLDQVAPYEGDYYIRTDGVNPDNKTDAWDITKYIKERTMTNFSLYDGAKYNYYWTKNVKNIISLNVKGCVANDYNKNLTGDLTESSYTDIDGNILGTIDSGTGVNLRFGYNPETNYFERAILRGSTASANYFLNVQGDNVFNDKACSTQELNEANYTSHPEYSVFNDVSDWVYEKLIYVKIDGSHPSASILLKSKDFYDQVMYQLGYTTDYLGHTTGIPAQRVVMGQGTSQGKYALRVIYDYKTNRLSATWEPEGQFDTEMKVDADILFVSEEGGDVKQVTFSNDNAKLTSLQSVMYIMELTNTYEPTSKAPDAQYWIALPFECKISDIFGIENYITLDDNRIALQGYWGIMRYRGDRRAEKGWFKEDDPEGFWEWMYPNESLVPGQGYVLYVEKKSLNWEAINVEEPCTDGYGCTDGKRTVSKKVKRFYFPSLVEGFTMSRTLDGAASTIEYPDQQCNKKGREAYDSNWKVIAPKSYDNIKVVTADPYSTTDQTTWPSFIYEYNPSSREYNAVDGIGTNEAPFVYQSFHGYMAQYAGSIKWQQYSKTEPTSAPRFGTAQESEFKGGMLTIELVQNNEQLDRTFVNLSKNGTEGFDQNKDLTKIAESRSTISTITNNVEYAGNTLPLDIELVPLNIKVTANGTYDIALEKSLEGLEVRLYDAFEQTTTPLDMMPATVTLDKGEYKDRFFLQFVQKSPLTPTNFNGTIEQFNLPTDKTKKLLINDNIYLINAGRIYNVLGVGE